MESGLISDGALAQDINQASSFWRIREVPIKLSQIFSCLPDTFLTILRPVLFSFLTVET
jgi:hypothetical protein